MGNEDALETRAAKMQFAGRVDFSIGLYKQRSNTRRRERERENGETTGTNRGVLQEEGRVEEAPDADEPAPPRHSRPRHSPRRLRHLPRRRSRSCAQLWVYLQSNNLGHVRTTFRFMFLLPNDLPSR
ncbi:uncharacterized protein LOC130778719 [Actinidia eriantha]|uniref:uncharacterized protein LOC130778719 n=1 Tax=Actinidia eriantha TaxID=165200 RepID=UPI00258B35E9|nr:uncharacterized protein LOC130778719 [Actinidia eriantha]